MTRRALAAACLAATLCATPALAEGDPRALPDLRWRVAPLYAPPGGEASRASGLSRFGAASAAAAVAIDLTRPGTISLWVAARGWSRDSATYVPIVRVVGRGGATLLVERDRRDGHRGTDVFISGLFSLARHGDVRLDLEVTPAWREERHFVALSWDATGFSVRLDARRSVRSAHRGVVVADEFPNPGTTVTLGADGRESLKIEDAWVWGRVLTDDELDALTRE